MDDMAFLNTKFNIKGQNKNFEILRLKLKKKNPKFQRLKVYITMVVMYFS